MMEKQIIKSLLPLIEKRLTPEACSEIFSKLVGSEAGKRVVILSKEKDDNVYCSIVELVKCGDNFVIGKNPKEVVRFVDGIKKILNAAL